MRRGSIALIVVGCLLVPIADLGVWTQLVILRTDEFTALADDILEREEVRDALAAEILDEIEQSAPRVGQFAGIVQPVIRDFIGRPEFLRIFRAAIARLHGQLVDGGDQLSLDLDEGLELIRAEVARVDADLADEIPTRDQFGEIVIATRDQAPYLWWSVEAANIVSVVSVVAVVGFLAFGIAMADRRWLALGVAGIGVAAASVLLVLVATVMKSYTAGWASGQVDERAFRAVWEVLQTSLLVQTLLVALVGVAMAVAGFLVEAGSTRRVASSV